MHASTNTTSTVIMPADTELVHASINRLSGWLDENDLSAYDTFDGLSSPILRPLTLRSEFLQTVLQQGVRRFPLNVRPLLGIPKSRSTKAMGFLARGFMRLHATTADTVWADKALSALEWLRNHQASGYSGACWGNHFDYQSRSFYLPKGVPTVVWTSLIGHAFLDAFEHFGTPAYLDVARSACTHIVRDLQAFKHGDSVCITYVPGLRCEVHNANTLGASLLARTSSFTGDAIYRDLARKSILYTVTHQQPEGSWYYGEKDNLHWIDNFHTAYVLDCLRHYSKATGDTAFDGAMWKGYTYWKRSFFLPDGTPKYYNHKTLPIDIQCCSQAIDTFVLFSDLDPEASAMAAAVAKWTIGNMQDKSGYFYYRRYSRWLVNKTPTLHWGQATMLCALAGLYNLMRTREAARDKAKSSHHR
jgi:polysaccharide biosynthesis protein VpsJ